MKGQAPGLVLNRLKANQKYVIHFILFYFLSFFWGGGALTDSVGHKGYLIIRILPHKGNKTKSPKILASVLKTFRLGGYDKLAHFQHLSQKTCFPL